MRLPDEIQMSPAPTQQSPAASPASSAGPQRRPTLADRLALVLLKLAKLRRVQLKNVSGDYDEFYEKFFEEKDEELSDVDPRMAHRRDTILRTLQKHVPPGASLLDVGCGIGDALLTMPDHYKLHAIDY